MPVGIKNKKEDMTGKETCKILKEIRQKIANENDIPFYTEECQYKGNCKGTCPKCEAELLYLEKELSKKRGLLNIVAATGISLALSSCQTQSSTDDASTDPTRTQENPVESTTNQALSDSIIPTVTSPVTLHSNMDMMGDVPYEPTPHHEDVFLRLQQFIVYPEAMIAQKREAQVDLALTIDSTSHIVELKTYTNEDPQTWNLPEDPQYWSKEDNPFTEAVKTAVGKGIEGYFTNVEFERQEYYIQIFFKLVYPNGKCIHDVAKEEKEKSFWSHLLFWK
jgi:hypothetical protein